MYRLLVLAFIVAILPLTARAQGGNVFFGYSYLNAESPLSSFGSNRSSIHGWDASLEGKLLPFVGIVADLSGHYGDEDVNVLCPGVSCASGTTSARQYNFVFGPRASVSVGKLVPFAHYLVGASHISTSGPNNIGSDTSFSQAVGGGIDYKLLPLIGWRFQGDFLQTRFFSNTQNNFRLSTGIVVRF